MWQSSIKERWDLIGVPQFLKIIGIDFEEDFLAALNNSNLTGNPYLENNWDILPNSQIKDGVLHCYPKMVEDRRVIWEEWFVMNGEIRHHILSNHAFDGEQGVWTPEPGDTDHPKEVLKSSWHYQNISNRKPSLL